MMSHAEIVKRFFKSKFRIHHVKSVKHFRSKLRIDVPDQKQEKNYDFMRKLLESIEYKDPISDQGVAYDILQEYVKRYPTEKDRYWYGILRSKADMPDQYDLYLCQSSGFETIIKLDVKLSEEVCVIDGGEEYLQRLILFNRYHDDYPINFLASIQAKKLVLVNPINLSVDYFTNQAQKHQKGESLSDVDLSCDDVVQYKF